MSIRHRIDDAIILWENNRHEGALLCALIAAAATARQEHPDLPRDRECFEHFFKNRKWGQLRVAYQNDFFPIESIFYKYLRNTLVHEGALPSDIEFYPDERPNCFTVQGGGNGLPLKLSHGWFHEIVNCVTRAPSNEDAFLSTTCSPSIPHLLLLGDSPVE